MKIKNIRILEEKWTLLIIKTLLEKDKSFSMIRKEIFGISDKILSQRLLEMKKEEILKRYVYTDIPVKVEYGLTAKGRNLKKAVSELTLWSSTHM